MLSKRDQIIEELVNGVQYVFQKIVAEHLACLIYENQSYLSIFKFNRQGIIDKCRRMR